MKKSTSSTVSTPSVPQPGSGPATTAALPLVTKTCLCGCGRTWRALRPDGWPFATSQCAAEKGVDVDFQAPHHEFNGAAMVASKIHQSIRKGKKKCKHHLKNL